MNALRVFQACWQLDRLSPGDAAERATEALISGADSAALRQLAGLSQPTFWEVRPLVEEVIKQAALPPMSEQDARWIIVYDLAEKIVSGALDPLSGTTAIAHEWEALHHPEVLSCFAYYWSDYGENPSDVPWFDAQIRSDAARLLAGRVRLA